MTGASRSPRSNRWPVSARSASGLASPELKANPYPFYRCLRAAAPAYSTRLLGQRAWLISRYADVSAVLRDERFVKDWPSTMKWLRRLSGPASRHMLSEDGPRHARLRALAQRAFTPRIIEGLHTRIQ